MKRILLCSAILSTFLNALDFDSFLQKALRENYDLQVLELDKKVTIQQSSKLTRYENPTLGIDYERFDPDISEDESGYSLSISQPIRLWGVMDEKKELAKAMVEESDLLYIKRYATLIYDISIAFSEYTKQKMLSDLADDEREIAKKIYEITKSRFDAGSISKKELLQAKSLLDSSEVAREGEELKELQRYYDLLNISGVLQELKIETNYNFKLLDTKSQNMDILYLLSLKRKISAEGMVNSIKSEYIELNANYEREPEQDISTIGLSIPLSLFNTKEQERMISKLKLKKIEKMVEVKKREYSLGVRRLRDQRERLLILRDKQLEAIKGKERLLDMLHEGYKISKSDILELESAKRSLIESRKGLIEIDTALNQNIITTNYMKGAYNE